MRRSLVRWAVPGDSSDEYWSLSQLESYGGEWRLRLFSLWSDTDAHCSKERCIFCNFEVAGKGRLTNGEGEDDRVREVIGFSLRCEKFHTKVVFATRSRLSRFFWVDRFIGPCSLCENVGWICREISGFSYVVSDD